jgi:hypothetical protein
MSYWRPQDFGLDYYGSQWFLQLILVVKVVHNLCIFLSNKVLRLPAMAATVLLLVWTLSIYSLCACKTVYESESPVYPNTECVAPCGLNGNLLIGMLTGVGVKVGDTPSGVVYADTSRVSGLQA